jgi:hypothetical protein
MRMRMAAMLVALAAVATACAVAYADAHGVEESGTDLAVAMKVTSSGGDASQGVAIGGTSSVTTKQSLDRPIVTGFDLVMGPGFSWNGGTHATCSKRTLERTGLKGCPRASVVCR